MKMLLGLLALTLWIPHATAAGEEEWITVTNSRGLTMQVPVLSKDADGVICLVEQQQRRFLVAFLPPEDRARLGYKDTTEEEEFFRGGRIVERTSYNIRIAKGGEYLTIRSAEMTPAERELYNIREPEEARRIEAEIPQVFGTIRTPEERAEHNRQQLAQYQAVMQWVEADAREYRKQQAAEAERQRAEAERRQAQYEAQRQANIEAWRLAKEKKAAQELREREVAAQERAADETARLRRELELRRIMHGQQCEVPQKRPRRY